MSPRDRRRVLVALAAFTVFAVLAGAATAWFHRHDTICRDGRVPVAQRDFGIGQIEYRCHDGEIVQK